MNERVRQGVCAVLTITARPDRHAAVLFIRPTYLDKECGTKATR